LPIFDSAVGIATDGHCGLEGNGAAVRGAKNDAVDSGTRDN